MFTKEVYGSVRLSVYVTDSNIVLCMSSSWTCTHLETSIFYTGPK